MVYSRGMRIDEMGVIAIPDRVVCVGSWSM